MRVRFFNDANGPPGNEARLLIGFAADHLAPAEMHEAVRLATDADMATYGDAYQAYLDSFPKEGGDEETKKAEVEAKAEEQRRQAQAQQQHQPTRETHDARRGR